MSESNSNSNPFDLDLDYERRKIKRDRTFDHYWKKEYAAAVDEFRLKQGLRYQKLKELNDIENERERKQVDEINRYKNVLYLAKYFTHEKYKREVEDIPDKPGYVKVTITAPDDNEIEWDESKLGPKPNPRPDPNPHLSNLSESD
jgi:hypothetical protein